MTANIIRFPKRDPSQEPPSGWVSRDHINDYQTLEDAIPGIQSWVDEGFTVVIEPLDNGEYRLFFLDV